MVSAWDLAIVGRAILHDKELAGIVRDSEETVNGPGLGKKVTNTNDLLYKYPSATGMKQAQSAKAGRVIVGSATRDQRTMIAVAFGVANPVAFASEKLDAGFASQPGAKGTGNRLPDVRGSSAQGRLEALVNLPPTLGRPALLPGPAGGQAKPRAGVPTATAGATTTPRKQKQHTGGGGGVSLLQLLLIVMLLGVVAALLMSRRRTVEQQRRQRVVRQRTLAEARRRGTIDIIDPDQVAGSGHVRIVGPARPGRPGRGGR
jgi:D-alanyl-D-alanine carboxypeptidase